MKGDLPAAVGEAVAAFKAKIASGKPSWATRKSSQEVLEVINPVLPDTIGGSADLTGSNNTKTASLKPLTAADPAVRYVYYGIREHAMAAAMNGMALHGGVIPYGGTFLVFSDYARNAIRMSALQRLRVVYVMTHDSIGLGEDGPTHQPIEHVMSLRMIPNLEVFRPCDTIETAECWQLALESEGTPTVLALSRQNLPQLRDNASENLSAKGGYTLVASASAPRVVLIATGSEVEIAAETAKLLEAQGIAANVVSMPSVTRFLAQDAGYRASVLPQVALRVSIDAGTTFGWAGITGENGLNIGIDRFGLSAPAPVLYDHFGLNAQMIATRIVAALN